MVDTRPVGSSFPTEGTWLIASGPQKCEVLMEATLTHLLVLRQVHVDLHRPRL